MDAPGPRTELVYSESVRALQVQSSSLDDLRSRTKANLDEMHREIAETNQKNWTNNNSKLDRLFWLFRFSVLLLVLQVGFWLISLGNSGASAETSKKTSEASVWWNESEKEGQQWQS